MKRTLFALVLGAAMLIVTPFSHAELLRFEAILNGPSENPSNASTATGFVVVLTDDVAHTMHIEVDFAGLLGGTASAAHIHCCVAPPGNVGVAVGMPAFPAVTSGSYDHDFNMALAATYSAGFLASSGGTAAGAEAALIAGMTAGRSYFNIHNATFPGGEIRGFLQAVPEPGPIALLGLGLAAGWVTRRRRRT